MATELADLLRQHDVQVTVQRIAVLRAVSGQPHITADGVAEVIRAELGVISKQAVYDALGILVERGLIFSFSSEDFSSSVFEIVEVSLSISLSESSLSEFI